MRMAMAMGEGTIVRLQDYGLLDGYKWKPAAL